MKTLIGINNLTEVNQLAYANHVQFFYRIGKSYPNDNFALCNPRRMSIDRMRNFCALVALESEFDYLMFIDDDVCLPVDAFQELVKHCESGAADIIAGVTYIRGYPFHPMIFTFKTPENHYYDNYADEIQEDGLVHCDAVGFSCCLMKMSVLRAVTMPYFITGDKHTEDVYFCQKAARQIPGLKIRVNPLVQTGHILGSDVIGQDSRLARMAYEEALDPSIIASVKKAELDQFLPETRGDRKAERFAELGIPIGTEKV